MNQKDEQVQKPHLSPGQLDTYCKCGEMYRRRYIEGEVIQPGIAMHKGTGMHGGSDVNFGQKLESFEDLPAGQIVDASVAAFEHAVEKRGYQLDDAEQSRGATVVIAEALDDVVDLANSHAKYQAVCYQPVLVEEAVRIVFPNSTHDLFGYLDMLAEVLHDGEAIGKRAIPDFKTTTKKKTQTDVDNSTQLTFYAAATKLLKLPPDEVRLDVLIKYKKGVSRQLLTSHRGKDDYEALSHRTNSVLAGIKAGIFAPATPGAWWCAPKWCGYWNTCPYVNAERAALSEKARA